MVLLNRGEVDYGLAKFPLHEEDDCLSEEPEFVEVGFFCIEKIRSIECVIGCIEVPLLYFEFGDFV